MIGLEEKCIELTNPADENYWAIRAIKNKQTTLNNEELIDFLQKVGNATFGFFKVGNMGLYYICYELSKRGEDIRGSN